MSRAIAMARRAQEAQISPSGDLLVRPAGGRRVAWRVAAILAGAGVLFWIFSPGSPGPAIDPEPRPVDHPRLPPPDPDPARGSARADLRCDRCGGSEISLSSPAARSGSGEAS